MNTAVINIKTDPKVKKQAQRVAAELGFSLSSLLNGYLRELVKTKTVTFSAAKEVPTAYMLRALKESEEDTKAGRVSTVFDNSKDALKWLNNPKRKYANQL